MAPLPCWRAIMLMLTLAPAFDGGPALADGSKILHFVPQYEAPMFDPVASVVAVVQQRAYLVYDTLFALDANGSPQPEMIGSYSLDPSGRTYTMTLRPGLLFHDGTPVRAADAVASIARWAKRDSVGDMLLKLGMQLAVVDDHTFTVTTRDPAPIVLEGFAKPAAVALFVMREKDASNPPEKPVSEVIGSGPFRFVASEYVPGSRTVYDRNPAYVPRDEPPSYYAGGKKAFVDRVQFDIMPDPAVAASALGKAEADILEAPPLDLVPLLKREKNVETHILKTGGMMVALRPNQLFAPFDNEKARQALLAMIDQSDTMDIAGGSDPANERECHAFMGCGSAHATEAGMEPYRKQNLELARRLVKESNYDGRPVVVLQPGDLPFMRDISALAAQEMRQIGFNVDMRTADWATITQRRASQASPADGGWNVFVTYTYDFELASPVDNFFLAAPCHKGGWYGWPCDSTLEDLRTQWAREAEPAKRLQLYEQIQRRSAVVVPYVPMGQYFTAIAYRNSVSDLLDVPLTVFWNVKKHE